MDSSTFLIIGANGQLGRALHEQYPRAHAVDVEELNITNHNAVQQYDWSDIKVILNAAAYTNVDGAETPEGKKAAQTVNADAVKNLGEIAAAKGIILVHISTDYVFDGSQKIHTEDEPFSPLGEYGKSKAEGDKAVMQVPKHYLLRASGVIGEGKNFVRTMLELAEKGVNPSVVSDQIGRLTFTSELVGAIDHLLRTQAPFGTYNVSNEGEPASWADITRKIYEFAGLPNTVTDVTTEQYYKDKPEAAMRPLNSTLDLTKIEAIGFTPRDWMDDLRQYVKQELES